MNKQIENLYNQCFVILEHDTPNTGFDANKFAEMIVRECARVSERTGSLNEADYEGEMIADAIKEHFGVEE